MQKEHHALQQLLAQKIQALEAGQRALAGAERTNEALERHCSTLREEVARLGEVSTIQAQQTQSMQERLIEATAQLKLLGAPFANSDGAHNT